MLYKPYPYQLHATQHVIDNPACGLFLEMGLGKTVSTLEAIDELLNVYCEVSKVLVIAPKKVAEDTWASEIQKWDHLKHLRLSIVLGSERQRKEALRQKADIYIINRENVAWLVALYGNSWPFDMMVIDELSSFKAADSIRFKALRKVRPMCKRVVGLTGTPAPNGLMDLWSQMYLLDQGARLGETLTSYRRRYFTEGKRNGHVVYNYDLKGDETTVRNGNKTVLQGLLGDDIYKKEIYDKISDICISMKSKDYLDLPKRVDRTRFVTLPAEIYEKYLDFEKKQILSMEDTEDITAFSAAALTNKLLQFANGAVYDEKKNYYEVHHEKLEALAEDVEAANGEPVLVFYSYRHDLDRIKKFLKGYNPKELTNGDDIKRWNNREISLLLAHPASAGHGLNLQNGGHHLEWFGVPWSLEWYQQGRSRVDRQGQLFPVINNRLITKGTMDEDVLHALDGKTNTQEALMQAVKARIKKYTS